MGIVGVSKLIRNWDLIKESTNENEKSSFGCGVGIESLGYGSHKIKEHFMWHQQTRPYLMQNNTG